AGRRAWKCKCPIWLDARIESKRILASMHLTDWQEAQAAAQKWIEEGSGGAKSVPSTPAPKEQTTPEVSLEQAWENFLARAKARNLRPATIYKYELLSRQMAAYAARRQIRFLQDFNLDRLEQFQAEWKEGPLSSAK